jgi:hypothetical protein
MDISKVCDKELLEMFARRAQGLSNGKYDDVDLFAEILHRMKRKPGAASNGQEE